MNGFNITRTSVIIGGVALVVGLLVGWIVTSLTSHGDDVATIAIYQDWRLGCPASTDKKLNCELSSDITEAKSHSRVGQIALGIKDDKKVMAITVPLSVLLPPGLGLKFGADAPTTYQYATCSPVGCSVIVPVDDKV